MRKAKALCLCLLCTVLLNGCGSKTESKKEPDTTQLRSFHHPYANIGVSKTLASFDKRPYLAVDETTELPETLPIYEDEFPTCQGKAQYSSEKISKEEGEAQLKDYLKFFCENIGQPIPDVNLYVEDFSPRMNQYWCDDPMEQITMLQYTDHGLGVIGSYEKTPHFHESIKDMDEDAMLADPFIKAAISYQNFQNPEFKKIWESEYYENHGDRHVRIAEPTDELKWNMLYEHFNSVELRSAPQGFRVSINRPLPKTPLAEARVIPYETAKEFVEEKYSCPVVYCEAAYDKDVIYPGRYLPVYWFYMQREESVFTRLVPMTDYPIPRGEEMQRYMDETFGQYATEYNDYEDKGNASSGSSSTASTVSLTEESMADLVEEWMPPPDRWQEGYEALSAEEQKTVRDWMAWYQALDEKDKEMLSCRPWGFGCFSEADVNAVMEAQDNALLQAAEECSEGQPRLWWSYFCSLPEYDPQLSQTAQLIWLREFAALSPEERAQSGFQPVSVPEAYSEEELSQHLKNIDPGVVKAVEEHVFSPGAWWHHYFRLPETSDTLESREKIMNWLLWYTGLSKEDQERADERTHLFFAAWEY